MQDPRGTGTIDGADPQGGILGKLLGESPAEIRARLEAASNEAKDLTGLVKKKKAATNGTAGPTAGVKRKEIPEEAVMDSDTAKKPRFNGTEEAEETKE